jgi:hypothetical protein
VLEVLGGGDGGDGGAWWRQWWCLVVAFAVVVVVASPGWPPPMFFSFFCFICRASQLRRTTKAIRLRLQQGAPSVAFFVMCSRGAWQRFFTVRV